MSSAGSQPNQPYNIVLPPDAPAWVTPMLLDILKEMKIAMGARLAVLRQQHQEELEDAVRKVHEEYAALEEKRRAAASGGWVGHFSCSF